MNIGDIKYFSMFSGIGGMEYGIEEASNIIAQSTLRRSKERGDGTIDKQRTLVHGRPKSPLCVGFSEIDKYAQAIYRYHYPGHKAYGDATRIIPEEINDFDLLVGGFPCQTFSIAGNRKGLEDVRGTLFYEIARIVAVKKPALLFLENVKGLLSHDNGRTFGIILETFSKLGYICEWQVLNSKNHGVPQNRERVFIIGHLREGRRPEVFPIQENAEENIVKGQTQIASTIQSRDYKGPDNFGSTTLIADFRCDEGLRIRKEPIVNCLQAQAREDGTAGQPLLIQPVLTPNRLEKRQNGRRFKDVGEPSFTLTSQDVHGIYDGVKIRRLTPIEDERLQGFPDGWTKYGIMNDKKIEISDSQRYKCLGNAVTTNVITAIIRRMYAN